MKIFTNSNNDADVAPVEVAEPTPEPVDEAALVPLVLLVPELGELGIDSIEDLARYLGDDVLTVAGLVRCTTRDRVAARVAPAFSMRARRDFTYGASAAERGGTGVQRSWPRNGGVWTSAANQTASTSNGQPPTA